VELLSAALKFNPKIKGISINKIPFNICICFKFQSTALSGPNPIYLCFIKICSQSRTDGKIISETQVDFMKGRYIGECTQLVCDLIDRCEDEEIPGLLILLDFEIYILPKEYIKFSGKTIHTRRLTIFHKL
jgi:hypothetical protein